MPKFTIFEKIWELHKIAHKYGNAVKASRVANVKKQLTFFTDFVLHLKMNCKNYITIV